ncbi:MAG: hypothetical protein ABSD29_16075 [Verrucomicrobiota bacterium]|jgi:hypothetical protein
MKEVTVALVYLAIAGFEILMHWFLLTKCSMAQGLLHIYLYRFPHSGKGVFGLLDIFLPSIVLGVVIGWVGNEWSLRKMVLFVALAAIGTVALVPSYVVFMGKNLVWWWPRTSVDAIVWFTVALFEAFALTGLFAYWGRCAHIRFSRL